jgi:hypothetical protein
MVPMHLVLVVPDLFDLARAADAAGSRLPNLARLAASASPPVREDDGIAAALAPHYGVARQADWPMAPIRIAAHGVDPGEAYWLAADPVTLVAGRDEAQVGAPVRDLNAVETGSIIATLNSHFASDQLHFVAPRPDAWFVRAPGVPALATRPLDAAQGRLLRTQMPTGADAKTWWRWQEEIQMLLFAHDVTAARAREGKASANGLWFSTGGTCPPRTMPAPSVATFGGDETAQALAVHTGTAARPLPSDLGAALAQAPGAATVLVAFAASFDAAAIDRMFAAPALAALVRGSAERVTLVANHRGRAILWTARRLGWAARMASRFRRSDLAALFDTAARELP